MNIHLNSVKYTNCFHPAKHVYYDSKKTVSEVMHFTPLTASYDSLLINFMSDSDIAWLHRATVASLLMNRLLYI